MSPLPSPLWVSGRRPLQEEPQGGRVGGSSWSLSMGGPTATALDPRSCPALSPPSSAWQLQGMSVRTVLCLDTEASPTLDPCYHSSPASLSPPSRSQTTSLNLFSPGGFQICSCAKRHIFIFKGNSSVFLLPGWTYLWQKSTLWHTHTVSFPPVLFPFRFSLSVPTPSCWNCQQGLPLSLGPSLPSSLCISCVPSTFPSIHLICEHVPFHLPLCPRYCTVPVLIHLFVSSHVLFPFPFVATTVICLCNYSSLECDYILPHSFFFLSFFAS